MTTKKYILAIDEGTTSCRAMLYDTEKNSFVRESARDVSMFYPQNGWVEQDAEEIYTKTLETIYDVLDGIDTSEVYAAGITNQRETVVVWDKSGKPLAPAINWQCRRTSGDCELIEKLGYANIIKNKTGLVLDPYFTATKLKWILDNTDGLRDRKGIYAGTIESYLAYRLTGGKKHITDITNASRTMLFNITDQKWDEELLTLFGIPQGILPEVTECAGDLGNLELKCGNIPLAGLAGDQQASLVGQACFKMGSTKCTYGTGAFMLTNIGKRPMISVSPLLTTIAYKIGGTTAYAFEGSVFNAGSCVQWVRDIGLIEKASDSEAAAFAAREDSGVYLVPAFTGLGTPYWEENARAAVVGITRSVGKNEIVRAALEGIAYRCYEVFLQMSKTLGMRIENLAVDGAVAENKFLMQFQSDLLGIPVNKSVQREATSLGVVYLAALGCGYYKSLDEITKNHSVDRQYKPSGRNCKQGIIGWEDAVKSVLKGEIVKW